MVSATIINFSEAKNRLFEVAYEWAVSEQKRNKLEAQPVNFDLKRDELTYDQSLVYVSVFYNEKTGEAIMRRDWDEDLVVQYNILANYKKLAKIAPKSLAKLKQNGVELYKRYCQAGFKI